MAETTKIAWATSTWNPWIGCSKVATGCTNCYAEADFDVRRKRVKWGPKGTRVKTSDAYWRNPIKWNREAGSLEHLGGQDRPRVFPSLCDPFEDWNHNVVGHQLVLNSKGETLWRDEISGQIFVFGEAHIDEYDSFRPRYLTLDHLRSDMFQLIDNTPNLDWLLLTKRPENILRMWHCVDSTTPLGLFGRMTSRELFEGKFRRNNVWLIFSASDQQSLEAGLPHLLACKDLVPVIGLSLEPLLGPIDLSLDGLWNSECARCADSLPDPETNVVDCSRCDGTGKGDDTDISWVIVGGESGPNARPCNVEWVRSIVRQCNTANVPVFVKQLGANVQDRDTTSAAHFDESECWPCETVTDHHSVLLRDIKGGNISEWPADMQVRQLPTV